MIVRHNVLIHILLKAVINAAICSSELISPRSLVQDIEFYIYTVYVLWDALLLGVL